MAKKSTSDDVVRIEWVFNRDPKKEGSQEGVDVAEARELVRTGRARYVDAKDAPASAPATAVVGGKKAISS